LIFKALDAGRPALRRSKKIAFFPKRWRWKMRISFASSTLASISWEDFK
jgi:hypothetical protein